MNKCKSITNGIKTKAKSYYVRVERESLLKRTNDRISVLRPEYDRNSTKPLSASIMF